MNMSKESMREDELSLTNNQNDIPERVKLKFVKSNLFRVIHVDSVWGTLTPNGNGINMNLCSQRFPIPQQVVYELDQDGGFEKEISEERIQNDDIEWEVEISAIMDIETAKELMKWLQNMVQQAENEKE
jgi:hypothetical protein